MFGWEFPNRHFKLWTIRIDYLKCMCFRKDFSKKTWEDEVLIEWKIYFNSLIWLVSEFSGFSTSGSGVRVSRASEFPSARSECISIVRCKVRGEIWLLSFRIKNFNPSIKLQCQPDIENPSKQRQRSGRNPSVADFIILIAWKQQTSLKFAYIGVCFAMKCAQQFNLTAFGCMHPRFVNGDVGRGWKWERRKKFKCKIMGWRDEQQNYLNGL